MDILDCIFIVARCQGCGGTYEVSARVARSAATMLHEGCPVQNERNCPELSYASLIDPGALDALAEAWARVEATARARGSDVLLRSAPACKDPAALSEERIDEALDESFPASDAPPWTLGVG